MSESIATGPAGDLPRLNNQCKRIHDRLLLSPATNAELSGIALNYCARLHDMRNAGYAITADRSDNGVWKYTLDQRPPTAA